jgi:Uma2 family endonuclease
MSIVNNQVWGAPDLVVEVMSPGTATHDRTEKLGWYGQYGVRECWLIDPAAGRIVIADFTGATPDTRAFYQDKALRSSVLSGFQPPASALLL